MTLRERAKDRERQKGRVIERERMAEQDKEIRKACRASIRKKY